MLEDLGNCVKIHDTVIPAVNIQVDPQEIFRYDHKIQMWIGLYFEILFEDGSLWEVTQEWCDDPIIVHLYPNWHKINQPGQDYIHNAILNYHIPDWENFLDEYQVRLGVLEYTMINHWNNYDSWMAA